MKRKVTKYTVEYKTEAVQLALKSPCISTTAKELGIPVATLHTWIKALKGQVKPSTVGAQGAKDMAQLIEENRRLHKENSLLKEEKDILKKAAVYFAAQQK
jgi:transposase